MGLIKKAVFVLIIAVILYWVFSRKQELPKDALLGKRVIVTGASSGIGEELAYHYCRLGANVVITARREDRLKKVIKKCRELSPSGKLEYYVADMGKEGDPTRFFKKAVKFLGGLDQLQINHGWIMEASEFVLNPNVMADTRKVMDINFHSFVELAKQAVPELEKTQGSIGVVSSGAGKLSCPLMLSYTASKHALTGFFKSLDFELEATHRNVSITVHTVGTVVTEGAEKAMGSYKEHGLDMDKADQLMPRGTAEATAMDIITATTLRQDELYTPANQNLYVVSILEQMSPGLLKNVGKWMGLMPEGGLGKK